MRVEVSLMQNIRCAIYSTDCHVYICIHMLYLQIIISTLLVPGYVTIHIFLNTGGYWDLYACTIKWIRIEMTYTIKFSWQTSFNIFAVVLTQGYKYKCSLFFIIQQLSHPPKHRGRTGIRVSVCLVRGVSRHGDII